MNAFFQPTRQPLTMWFNSYYHCVEMQRAALEESFNLYEWTVYGCSFETILQRTTNVYVSCGQVSFGLTVAVCGAESA